MSKNVKSNTTSPSSSVKISNKRRLPDNTSSVPVRRSYPGRRPNFWFVRAIALLIVVIVLTTLLPNSAYRDYTYTEYYYTDNGFEYQVVTFKSYDSIGNYFNRVVGFFKTFTDPVVNLFRSLYSDAFHVFLCYDGAPGTSYQNRYYIIIRAPYLLGSELRPIMSSDHYPGYYALYPFLPVYTALDVYAQNSTSGEKILAYFVPASFGDANYSNQQHGVYWAYSDALAAANSWASDGIIPSD